MKNQIFASSKNLQWIFSVLSFIVMIGCSKEELTTNESISVKGSKDAIPTYYFDWDNTDYMPIPPGTPNTIYVPWELGVAGSISGIYDASVWADHKQSDGWELLYSSFNPNDARPTAMPHFILYNKYRGVMRIYQYNDTYTANLPSTYLQIGLNWAGNGNGSNKALNFINDIVDVTNRQTSYSAILPAPENGQKPVCRNSWYMFQFEIEYDPSLSPLATTTPSTLSWYVNYYNIQEVKLNGTAIGTINGTIGSSTLGQNLNNAVGKGANSLGTVLLAGVGTSFFDTNKLKLPTSVFNPIKSGVASALSSAVGGLPGAIMNIASAIFGGNSNGNALNLDLKADLTLSGNVTEQGSLFPTTTIPMPGSIKPDNNNNYLAAFIPYYNKPLGVFTLSNTPTITASYSVSDTYTGSYFHQYSYAINDNSFNIQWNPAVLEVATIQNLTKEVIVKNLWGDYTSNILYNTGRVETIQGGPAWTGKNNFDVYFMKNSQYPQLSIDVQEVLLRISFVVHPKNGAPDVTIVKTFKANKQMSYNYPY